MKFGIFFMALMLMAVPLHAGVPEMPQLRQLSTFDGLPSDTVHDMAEDREGYLWFATADGLARYDGHGFRVWRRENGLSDNVVDCVFVDADDTVWIGTNDGGLAVFDKQRRAPVYLAQIGGVRLDASPIWDIVRSADGDLWIGTVGAGLLRVHAGRAQRFLPKDGDAHALPGEIVTELALDAHGALWVATNQGAARWNGSGFERVAQGATASPYVTGLVPDRDGSMWLRSVPSGAVLRKGGVVAPLPWQLGPDVTGHAAMDFGPLLQDREGGYWLYTTNGLVHADEDGMQVVPVYSNLNHGLARPQFERALVDRDGGLWFTSEGDGVWHLPSDWRRFAVLSYKQDALTRNAPDSLGNAQVLALSPSRDGGIWLAGTSGVLDKLDPETGRVRHVFQQQPRRVINAVHESRDGAVWLGMSDAIARFDPRTQDRREWKSDSRVDALLAGDVIAIAEDADGLVWSWQDVAGAQARDPQGHLVHSVAGGAGRGLPPSLTVSYMHAGKDGAIWLASSAGLLAWDKAQRRFAVVRGVGAGEVDGFAFADADTVWLARMGAVEAYAWRDGALQLQRRIDEGLPQVAFTGVVVDHRGVLWLASMRGLVRLNPATGHQRTYGIEDGLPGQEILSTPAARAGDGRLVAAASHGVLVFDPVVLRPSDAPPRLIIDTLSVRRGDKALTMPTDAPFKLAFDDRDLHVVARLLSYDNVRGHRYRFRLSGFDDDWVEVGNEGERSWSRLAPGKYQLQVQGFNADNIGSPVREVRFEVVPPWWQRWWALAGFALLALLLLALAANAYRKRVRRKHAFKLAEEKHRLAEQASLAKTQFLATLGHEVRTPMTGVLGMSELLQGTALDAKQRGYVNAIRNAGAHLLRLVNDALDLARIEAGKLELQQHDFDLRELLAGVTELVAPQAAQRGLEFTATLDADAPRGLHGDALRVRQILLNLLGNAVKFTEHGSVGLRVQALDGGGVRLLVSDTGPGLNAEQQARLFHRFEQADGARTAARYGGSGLGLAICRELAQEMGGRIGVDSAPRQGTRFVVELPLPDAQAPLQAAQKTPASASTRGLPALDVLLVEDDATVAEVMLGLLQAQGHRVVHAGDGLQALSEVASHRFDIALLDLDLPGLDGLDLARQLRGIGFAAPLLAVTARADMDAEPQAKAAGFDGFLRKPLTGEMLFEAMRPLLGAQWRDAE